MRQKGYIFLPLIIIALIGIVGYLVYRNTLLKKSNTSLTVPSIVPTTNITEPSLSSGSTIGWKRYRSESGRFEVLYPADIIFNQEQKGTNKLGLYTNIKNLNNYVDEPMGYDLETALKDKAALERGSNLNNTNNNFPEARKLIKIDGLNARTEISLQEIEICDVRFIRKLVFYNNEHQIILYLSAPSSYVDEMPEYFTTNPENCSNFPVWKSPETFYNDLISKIAPKIALDWYSLFDEIISTIKILY